MSITGGMQGTLGGMALVYMYTATDQGFGMGCVEGVVVRVFYFNNLYDSIIMKLRLVMSFYE